MKQQPQNTAGYRFPYTNGQNQHRYRLVHTIRITKHERNKQHVGVNGGYNGQDRLSVPQHSCSHRPNQSSRCPKYHIGNHCSAQNIAKHAPDSKTLNRYQREHRQYRQGFCYPDLFSLKETGANPTVRATYAAVIIAPCAINLEVIL